MKKILGFLIAVAFSFAIPASAEFKDMWAKVYALTDSNQLNYPVLSEISSGITFKVLQRNSDTAETLYEFADNTMTSLTNPVTTTNFESATVCDDKVAFKVDPGETNDTYVDLIVVDTSGGYTAFVEDFDEYTHKIVIDERAGIMHHGVIWYSASATVGAETDTGIDFDYDSLVHSVVIESVTETGDAAGQTMDAGLLSTETAGDLNGFCAGVDISTATIYVPPTIANSGALLDDGANYNPDGHFIEAANAVSLVYANHSTDAAATGVAGYIHYWFTRTR
jgi:hypothetical protein